MGLYDFFFPAQAHAEYIRRISETGRRVDRARQAERDAGGLERRVAELEKDTGYLALVLGSLLETLDRKGVVTRDEVKSEIARLDALDGVKEGRLDVRVLREKTS